MSRFNRSAVCVAIVAFVVPAPASAWQNAEPYMKTRSRIIGVQASPLSAYPTLLRQHFPNGVPSRESGTVLELLRAKKARQLLGRPTLFDFGTRIGIGRKNVEQNHQPRILRSSTRGNGSVADLVVSTSPINTDHRLDINALLLSIRGVDVNERVVPLHGTIQATLYGLEDRHDLDHSIRDSHALPLPSMARVRRMAIWVRPISIRDSTWQTRLKLPPTRPDTDPHWSSTGVLHLRVAIPGVGIFEKSQQVIIGSPASRRLNS